MKIQIIKVPYDCDYKAQRQGLEPDRFLKHNIDRILEADGHLVYTRITLENFISA